MTDGGDKVTLAAAGQPNERRFRDAPNRPRFFSVDFQICFIGPLKRHQYFPLMGRT